jgi:hypothetical protein
MINGAFVLFGKKEAQAMSRSSIIIEGDSDLLPNPHPGEILLEEFLKPMGLARITSREISTCRAPH